MLTPLDTSLSITQPLQQPPLPQIEELAIVKASLGLKTPWLRRASS
ncbi:MAG: hypothetical protein JZD41_02890 [Thermoproteus sp.]|nr:hypothetical protein [Thermoproteus sp.]